MSLRLETPIGVLWIDEERKEYVEELIATAIAVTKTGIPLETILTAALYLQQQERHMQQMATYKREYRHDYAVETSSPFERLMQQGGVIEGKTVHFTPYDKEESK